MAKTTPIEFARYAKLIIITLLIILLSSCAHYRKDGPPDFDVDVSKIPDAVPKDEPLAKYGNMSSYRVFGKRYYTLKSSAGYDQVGTASWYGTKFDKVKTSSGERYNMLAMTAAHKTLPLPTYVEVTNLKNNRKVIVKVNDRGPFESNRLIDLSYVAAKKLGMLGHGTTRVRVKAINPDSFSMPTFLASRIQRRSTPPAITSHRNFSDEYQHPLFRDVREDRNTSSTMYLQVGAFRSKTNALRLKKQLANVVESPITVTRGTSLYHVKVGPLRDMTTANKLKNRLNQLGIKSNKIYAS